MCPQVEKILDEIDLERLENELSKEKYVSCEVDYDEENDKKYYYD